MTSNGWESGLEQRPALGGRHPLGWSVRTLVPLGRFTPSPTQAPLDTENTLQRRAAEIVGLPPELGDGSAFTTFSADVATVLTTVPETAVQSLPLPAQDGTVAESPLPEPISRNIPETLPTATAPIDLPSESTAVSAEPAPTETFPQPVQRQPLGQSQPLGFQKPELSGEDITQDRPTASPATSPGVVSEPSPQTNTPSLKRPVPLQPATPSAPGAVVDSDSFSETVRPPETVPVVEENTDTALPSEAASLVEPMQSTAAQPSPPTDSTELAPPAVAPTATPDSDQAALAPQTRSQTSAHDIVPRQPLELPSQKVATPDTTDKIQTPSTLWSEENELGAEGTATPPLQPFTDLQDAPGESPIAPDSEAAATVQPRPKPPASIQEAPQPPDVQSLPEQDSPRGVETQTVEELPSPQSQSLETVQPNAETVTTPIEVTPVQSVASNTISPQADPANPNTSEQLIAQAAPSPQASVSTTGPSPSTPESLSPKISPDQPAATDVAEIPTKDGHRHLMPDAVREWERGKEEQEQPTLPTVRRVPLGQTAPTPIVPLARSTDVDLSGLSTVSPEPTLPKVAQTGETKSFPTPIEKTDSIQKKAAPLLHQLEAQPPDVPVGREINPETDPETGPEPWTDQFDLEPSQSKTTTSFLLPDRAEETVLPHIREVEREVEETVAIESPREPDMASQASDGVTVVSPLATQQASLDEALLEDLAQIIYGQLRSHLHQLHESRHGRAIPVALGGDPVWPLPLHQLATVVRQQVESRLRSDLERRPIHHR